MSSEACVVSAASAVEVSAVVIAEHHEEASAPREDRSSSRNVVDLGSLSANTGSLEGLLEETRQGENGASGVKPRSNSCPVASEDAGKSGEGDGEPEICLQSAGTTACDATCSSVVSVASPRGTAEAEKMTPTRDEGVPSAATSGEPTSVEPAECTQGATSEPQRCRATSSPRPEPLDSTALRTSANKDGTEGGWTGDKTPEWHNTPELSHATIGTDRQHCPHPASALLDAGLSSTAPSVGPSSANVPYTRLRDGNLTYQGGMMPAAPYNEAVQQEYAVYSSTPVGPCPPSGSDYIIETLTTCLRGVSISFTGLLYTQNSITGYEVSEQLYQATAQGLTPGQGYYHDTAYAQDASARTQQVVPQMTQDRTLFEALLGSSGQAPATEQHLFGKAFGDAASRQQQQYSDDMSNSQRSTSITDQDMAASLSLSAQTGDVPNAGSMGHAEGTCKPCAFLYTKGCENGINCPFCHLCEPGEKKKRRKAKMEVRRTARKWQRPAAPWFCDR